MSVLLLLPLCCLLLLLQCATQCLPDSRARVLCIAASLRRLLPRSSLTSKGRRKCLAALPEMTCESLDGLGGVDQTVAPVTLRRHHVRHHGRIVRSCSFMMDRETWVGPSHERMQALTNEQPERRGILPSLFIHTIYTYIHPHILLVLYCTNYSSIASERTPSACRLCW
jgi:hypothetical protein